MRLVLDLGGTTTRSITDENASASETTIEHLHVIIYGANGIFEKAEKVLFGDLTSAGANTDKFTTKEIETTTGKKTIYVGVNMNDDMINFMKATPVNSLTGKGFGKLVSDISTTNQFVMFSTVGATPDLVEDPNGKGDGTVPTDNEVAVTVQRLAAKIAVGMTANLTDTDVQQGAAGTISNLGFVVDNINKMYYLTYGAAGALEKDANMEVGQYDKKDFEMIADFAGATYETITPGTPYVKNNGGNWGIKYASENLTTDKMIKGVTRIVVKGKFTPKKGYKVGGTAPNYTFTEEDGVIATDATYILLDFPEAGGFAFFPAATTDDELKAFMAMKKNVDVTAIDATVLAESKKTYTNSLNYWWVTVKDNQGDMLRNKYYKVDITSIFAPGRTDGAFDDNKDDTQIGKETNITVAVTVEDWKLVEFGADLRP